MKRGEIDIIHKDFAHDAYKANPMVDWTAEMIRRHVIEIKIPCNILHDKGFPSIGCGPCTRAVNPEKTSAPDAGGGKQTLTPKNAASM